jgi:hypothetical protein
MCLVIAVILRISQRGRLENQFIGYHPENANLRSRCDLSLAGHGSPVKLRCIVSKQVVCQLGQFFKNIFIAFSPRYREGVAVAITGAGDTAQWTLTRSDQIDNSADQVGISRAHEGVI